MKQVILGLLAGTALTTGAMAEAPRVVADIAPVHSLVARVMEGVGKPSLLIRPETSPHNYAMRPSEAKALQEADLIFWIGHELTPRLEKNIETIGQNAISVELIGTPGLVTLSFRENPVFELTEEGHEGHDDHAEHKHDDHGHGDHDDHAEHKDEAHGHDDHDGHSKHNDHTDEHGDHKDGHHDHAHDHDGTDPHIWLDPQNAVAMTAAIADALAKADPDNASTYAANAQAAEQELGDMIAELKAVLAPVEDKPFVVFHDAYHYFENRFGLEAAGAILVGDAASPSAGRLAELRDAMQERQVVCVFAEPQFDPKLVKAVAEGVNIRSVELDPLGVGQTQGATLYTGMVRSMATDIAGCLKD
ncbi:zinc ABC transporter substrate-binding protein [Shimia sp. SDUM112013]|uniref:zinc ABC transporter substrate-binding protein n=1 Tax=Shimia sp. SDUM112013 TaxID=3136160 RepID=UPI0032EFA922